MHPAEIQANDTVSLPYDLLPLPKISQPPSLTQQHHFSALIIHTN